MLLRFLDSWHLEFNIFHFKLNSYNEEVKRYRTRNRILFINDIVQQGIFSAIYIGDLLQRKVVASFAFFFVKRYGNDMSGMEFTATVGFDEVCVIIPKAANIPKGLRMYQIFELTVWLCIILSYTVAYLAWYYIQVFASRRYL